MGRKNKEVNPFSWDNISINKYYEIMDILNAEDDDITKNVKLIALIMDKDEDEIWNMDLNAAGDLIGKLLFLNKFDIPENPKGKIVLPNYVLNISGDVTNMSVAQYVDFQNFATMPLRDGIDKILSIFLIPDGKTYNNGYDVLDLQKEIRENMTFRVAQGMLSFFLKRSVKLLTVSLTYLSKTLKKTKNPEMREQLMQKEERLKKELKDLICLIG